MNPFTQEDHWPTWPIWDDLELEYLKLCLESRRWSRGQIIKDFEEAFARFCGSKHALLVNTGTEALVIALKAVGVGPGDEVIVPGLTWPSTALAVLECGAKAIIVDIDIQTYSISIESIRENLSPKTKAIIAVHLFNSTADLDALPEIVSETDIHLIEDAAQAHGCRWRGKHVGNFGSFGAFSFQQKKIITCGEGGCLITNNDELYSQAYSIRDHGARWNESKIQRYGGNSRISGFNTAILLAQLRRLPKLIEIEGKAGKYLTERLNCIPGIVCLEKREAITQQSYYSFCFRLLNQNLFDNSAAIRQNLSTLIPIEFTSTYPALDDKSFFKPFLEKRYTGLFQFSKLENCHRAYQEAIRFPHHYLLASDEQLNALISNIENVIEGVKNK